MEVDFENLALKSDHSLQEQEKLLFNYTPEEAIEKIKPKWAQYDVEKKKNLLKLLKCCYGDDITNNLIDFKESQVTQEDIINPIDDNMKKKSELPEDSANTEIGEDQNEEEKEEEDIRRQIRIDESIKEFIQDYAIFWHDPNVNSSENQKYLDQLSKFCEVKTFTEWEKAGTEIQKTKRDCLVITSGTNGKELAKKIDSCQNVKEIYVFCKNEKYHSTWAQKYQKISGIETKLEDIIGQIKEYFCK